MNRTLFVMAALLLCGVFTIAAAAPPPTPTTSFSGTLTASKGQLFLTDSATGKTMVVHGKSLQKYAGQKVTVSGKVTPATGNSPAALEVTSIKATTAAAGAGSKAAAAGIKGGLSKGAAIGLAGSGATAATVGSLYAADAFSGSDQSVSRP